MLYFEALPNVKKDEKKRSAPDLNSELGSGLPDTTIEMRNLTTFEPTTAEPTTSSFVYGYLANMKNLVSLSLLARSLSSIDPNVLNDVEKNSINLMREITAADFINTKWLGR